ncbi:hypothetical protein BKA61DRAFT_682036 [Leptodontidium sp. MPI-SDFR-AT-0119]|nr:hypothetical protein BKA61DRAFT_682036 [Leptodontidium sp. MPI-SDFR-AT-0119]
MELPIVLTAVPLPGGANWNVPYDRLLEALGSNRNRANFVLLLHALNGLKSQIWRRVTLFGGQMEALIEDLTRPEPALIPIRDVISVFMYLNDPDVNSRMISIANEFRTQLTVAQDTWNAGTTNGLPNIQVNIVRWWDLWFPDHLRAMTEHARDFLETNLDALTQMWGAVFYLGQQWSLR